MLLEIRSFFPPISTLEPGPGFFNPLFRVASSLALALALASASSFALASFSALISFSS